MPGSPHEHPPARDPGSGPGDLDRTGIRASGAVLFGIYLVLYGAFVLLNAFQPASMEASPVLGVNFAVLYGMCLIGGAFVLALLHTWLARGRQP
jgi:uncharacterized membrane protein (DUF485 family)